MVAAPPSYAKVSIRVSAAVEGGQVAVSVSD